MVVVVITNRSGWLLELLTELTNTLKKNFLDFFLMGDMNDKDYIYRINASSDVAVCLR